MTLFLLYCVDVLYWCRKPVPFSKNTIVTVFIYFSVLLNTFINFINLFLSFVERKRKEERKLMAICWFGILKERENRVNVFSHVSMWEKKKENNNKSKIKLIKKERERKRHIFFLFSLSLSLSLFLVFFQFLFLIIFQLQIYFITFFFLYFSS